MGTIMSNQNITSNLDSIDVGVNDNTTPNTYFNNYFGPTVNVSPNVDSAIISYFGNRSSGDLWRKVSDAVELD